MSPSVSQKVVASGCTNENKLLPESFCNTWNETDLIGFAAKFVSPIKFIVAPAWYPPPKTEDVIAWYVPNRIF